MPTQKELNPSTLLSPVPAVMISCCDAASDAKPNIITLAWVGTVCSEPPMLSISIRPSRLSYDIIKATGEFAVNLVSRSLCEAMDFCGVRSGREVDKFAHLGLTPCPLQELAHAPGIAESPVILACKVKQVLPLGSHDMFVAEIVGVKADTALFDDSDRLCLERADLVGYTHGDYYAMGEHLGFFGYSVAAPDVRARRMQQAYARGHYSEPKKK